MTITFSRRPDPYQTHLADPEQVYAVLDKLEPGATLVLAHRHEESIDMETYLGILRDAQARGHDVVVVLEQP